MKNRTRTILAVVAAALTAGCYSDPMSQRGFSLPEGDMQAGRDAFLYMQCNQCHTVANESLPPIPGAEPYVELGGNVSAAKSYGELVTGIINPSHKLAAGYQEEVVTEDGESRMYNYNQYMTVQELIDLVAFLQPHYQVVMPETPYRPYLYR